MINIIRELVALRNELSLGFSDAVSYSQKHGIFHCGGRVYAFARHGIGACIYDVYERVIVDIELMNNP